MHCTKPSNKKKHMHLSTVLSCIIYKSFLKKFDTTITIKNSKSQTLNVNLGLTCVVFLDAGYWVKLLKKFQNFQFTSSGTVDIIALVKKNATLFLLTSRCSFYVSIILKLTFETFGLFTFSKINCKIEIENLRQSLLLWFKTSKSIKNDHILKN